MNAPELLWFVALVGVAAIGIALGYFVNVVAGALFWLIATLILLAVRPI